MITDPLYGEVPAPSFVKVRRFKGNAGWPSLLGHYEGRFIFVPLAGQEIAEPLAVRPDEIEEWEQ